MERHTAITYEARRELAAKRAEQTEAHHRQFGRTITHRVHRWETYEQFVARTDAIAAAEANPDTTPNVPNP